MGINDKPSRIWFIKTILKGEFFVSNENKNQIRVIVVNPPSKEESEKKIRELSEFLSSCWHLPIKTH